MAKSILLQKHYHESQHHFIACPLTSSANPMVVDKLISYKNTLDSTHTQTAYIMSLFRYIFPSCQRPHSIMHTLLRSFCHTERESCLFRIHRLALKFLIHQKKPSGNPDSLGVARCRMIAPLDSEKRRAAAVVAGDDGSPNTAQCWTESDDDILSTRRLTHGQ